jgi:hypothetical protein
VLPLSASQSSRGRNLVKFGPMLAQEAPFCRAHAGVKSSSSCIRNLMGVVRSVSGSAMGQEAGEGKAGSSGNGAVEQGTEERAPLVVVSFYKFANLPDYEQKRAPLKELCETYVRISTFWWSIEP